MESFESQTDVTGWIGAGKPADLQVVNGEPCIVVARCFVAEAGRETIEVTLKDASSLGSSSASRRIMHIPYLTKRGGRNFAHGPLGISPNGLVSAFVPLDRPELQVVGNASATFISGSMALPNQPLAVGV